MITYILRAAGYREGGLYGTIRHAASGETRPFAGSAELVAVIEEWNAIEGIGSTSEEWHTFEEIPPRRAEGAARAEEVRRRRATVDDGPLAPENQ